MDAQGPGKHHRSLRGVLQHRWKEPVVHYATQRREPVDKPLQLFHSRRELHTLRASDWKAQHEESAFLRREGESQL